MKVEVYRGQNGFEALASDWQQLLANLQQRRFFHAYGWWKSYMAALEDDPDSLSFYLLRHDEKPAAIVPLKRSVGKYFALRWRKLHLPEHPHLVLSDILCSRDVPISDVLSTLIDSLREQERDGWDALEFANVLEESPLAEYAASARERTHATVLKTCDQLMCEGTLKDMVATFSQNFRANLSKARNKLARHRCEFESVTKQPHLAGCMADLLDLEASGWKGAKGTGTAIKLHPELLGFYGALVEEFGASDAVMINCLRVDGALIAGQFCVSDDDTLYILKLAYDEAWSRVAPGNMLLEHVVQEGIAGRGFKYINLVGNPPWFKDWRPMCENVYGIWLFNRTPMGWALRNTMKAKRWLRPLYRKYLKGRLGSAMPRNARPPEQS